MHVVIDEVADGFRKRICAGLRPYRDDACCMHAQQQQQQEASLEATSRLLSFTTTGIVCSSARGGFINCRCVPPFCCCLK